MERCESMIIKSYKVSEQPKIKHKISENELYKQYLTESRDSLKIMKMQSQAYKELLIFHDYRLYREYLVDLSKLMGDDSIINTPLEVYSYLGHVRGILQSIQAGQMSFDSLAPKLDLDSLLKSLKVFYSELTSIDSLDLTHVTSQDIVYGGKVEIFNPEHIKIVKCDKRKNIGHINREIIKGIFGLDSISKCDADIKDILESTIVGEIGADILLSEISKLESKRRGKAKYLKHINSSYIK